MGTDKSKPSLTMLLTRYDFCIDYDKPHRLVIEDSDILLSSHGRLDNLNYLYLLRPSEKDEDWKVYYIKNKNVGYLPSSLTNSKRSTVQIVKRVKTLLNPV